MYVKNILLLVFIVAVITACSSSNTSNTSNNKLGKYYSNNTTSNQFDSIEMKANDECFLNYKKETVIGKCTLENNNLTIVYLNGRVARGVFSNTNMIFFGEQLEDFFTKDKPFIEYLVGKWNLTGIIEDGKRREPKEPIYYEFFADGTMVQNSKTKGKVLFFATNDNQIRIHFYNERDAKGNGGFSIFMYLTLEKNELILQQDEGQKTNRRWIYVKDN